MHCGTWRRGGVLSHTCEPQPRSVPPCRDTFHMLLEVGQHIYILSTFTACVVFIIHRIYYTCEYKYLQAFVCTCCP